MGRKNKTQFDINLNDKLTQYNHYYDNLYNIALSRFKWENLPPELDRRYIEKTLFMKGKICFFYDKVLKNYITLPFTLQAQEDIYGNTQRIRATSRTTYNKVLDKDEYIAIYNNLQRDNELSIIEFYAKKLAQIDEVYQVNLNSHKTPLMIKASEEQRLTLTNLVKQYEGGSPFIFSDKNFDTDNITVLQTNSPFLLTNLSEEKTKIYNECLTHLGIANVNTTKKERLVSNEVERHLGGVFANRNTLLLTRKEAVEKINEKWGLDIKVSFIDMLEDEEKEDTPKEKENEGKEVDDE